MENKIVACLQLSRSEEGRNLLRVNGDLSYLCNELVAINSEDSNLISLLKCLNNCLINCQENGMFLIDNGTVQEILSKILRLEPSENTDVSLNFLLYSLKFIFNFISSGQLCAIYFWNQFGIAFLQQVFSLSISFKSNDCVGMCVAILHSCLSKDDPTSTQRRDQLMNERGFCCQVLLAVIDLQYTLLMMKEKKTTQKNFEKDSQGKDSDVTLKWFHIFLMSLFLKGYGVRFLRLVGRESSSSPASASSSSSCTPSIDLTHEQIILLNGYQGVFEDALFVKQTKQQTLSEAISPSLSSFLELHEYLLSILSSHFNQISSSSSSPTFQQIDAETLSLASLNHSVSQSLSIPVIPTIFECLSSMIVCFDEIYSESSSIEVQSREIIRRTVLEKEVDDICLRILMANKRRTSTNELQSSEKLYWNDVIKSCLNLLMNLSFHSQFVQDSVRERGGLPIILSYCVTDFDNPLCREFSLMTIRNLCEGNSVNQSFIESLQPQQVLQDPELLARGIEIEMDPLSGKFKFNQKNKSSEER